MKTPARFAIHLVFIVKSFVHAQDQQTSAAINWQNFSCNFNILAVSHYGSKPLQYNNELDLVSFVQRISPYYPCTPAPSPFAANGVVVGYLTSNWGASWDSTCLWQNDHFVARYPQGGVYNPPGNSILGNAFLLGTGPYLDTTQAWGGNWSASKSLSVFNTSASAVANAQQLLPSIAPLPPFGKCHFSRNSFASTDDGLLHSLAKLDEPNTSAGYRGAMVLSASFQNGAFVWTGDSIECPTYYTSSYLKIVDTEALMAWNETGTMGYVVFLGSRDGGLASNFGMQPIVYRSTNSGNSWQLAPAMDFNSPAAQDLKNLLPTVNAFSPNPTLTIPNVVSREGWDVVVDKNNSLHVVGLVNGASSGNFDSIANRHQYGSESYDWPHVPGRRPYLVDFILSSNLSWSYGVVDSLSSEAPGSLPFSPGYSYNNWGLAGVSNLSRIQCSRTPDGRFVLITWAETDSTTSLPPLKWNRFPDLKARLIDCDAYALSPTEIQLTAGTHSAISGAATMHYVAPRCAAATVTTNSYDLKVPVTISNNPGQLGLLTSSNWFSAAELSFSKLTAPFAQPIPAYFVSLDEQSEVHSSGAKVFPNPSANSFTIQKPQHFDQNWTVEVYDVAGKRVYSDQSREPVFELQAGELAKGVYVLRLSAGLLVDYRRLIRE